MAEYFEYGNPLVAVNKDGSEYLYETRPFRTIDGDWAMDGVYSYIKLPKGSIKKLIGRDLFWEDEPIELEEE